MEHGLFIFVIIALHEAFKKIVESRRYFAWASGGLFFDGFAFAEGPGGEKTEAPTPKKIRDARKKGQVAKSPDLNAAIILLVTAIFMVIASDQSIKELANFIYINFTEYLNYNLVPNNLRNIFLFYIISFLKLTAVMFMMVMVVGIAANLAQSGFLFSLDPLKPKLSKLNPIEGLKNIFSKKSVFNMIKTILKLVLIGSVAFSFSKESLPRILATTGVQPIAVWTYVKEIILSLMVKVILVLLGIGIVDFIFQKYDFKKNLRMTKQEIKEEWKQSEGDPHIKSKRKQKQREMSMNRMMSDVASATAIITNPTHLAVAIRYEEKIDEAPKVVGKGADYLAEKIRKKAKESNIPIIENKVLARTMYKQLEIGQEIPATLYKAVAEILAIVMNMKKKEN